MSDFSRNDIREFGIKSISKILPLDNDTLSQMIEYALNNLHSRDAMTKHFTELIGEDPDCLDFITKFESMVFGNDTGEISKQEPVPKPKVKQNILASTTKPKPRVKNVWENKSKLELKPKQEHSPRLSKALSSSTTSELLDKKPSTQKKNASSKSSKKRTLKNLQDVESALAQLEIGDTVREENEPLRKCNCMGTRHPLFEFYPNCLNCGKIICSKEGLQPCSFCGKELLTESEKLEILNVLTMEKMDLEAKAAPIKQQQQQKPKKQEKIKISINAAGEHNLRKQDLFFKKLELQKEREAKTQLALEEEQKKLKEQDEELKYHKERHGHDPELLKAQERLDKLLNFQSTGAERTKIIDRASDFDMPNRTANLWTSPLERALQLKKQQRQLRKQQEAEKERTGHGRKVLDMTIRDGKVILREQVVKKAAVNEGSDDDDYIVNSEDEEDLRSMKQLQAEIASEKQKEESKKIATFWDYEKDKEKWEKPVYLGNSDDVVTYDDNDIAREHFNRVQLSIEGTSEEMLVGLPTL